MATSAERYCNEEQYYGGLVAHLKQRKISVLRLSLYNPTIVLLLHFIILNQVMINLRITGLYNRGQQDNWKQRHVATSKDSCSYVISTMRKASQFIARPASMSFPIRIFARETESVFILVSPKRRKSVLQKE